MFVISKRAALLPAEIYSDFVLSQHWSVLDGGEVTNLPGVL